jgi:signal transduction histidine kinase
MRSLYLRIVIASFVTVVISLGAFVAIGRRVVGSAIEHLVDGAYTVQLDEAIAAYQRGGAGELAQFTHRMDEALQATHYLVDADGRDLVTGTDRRRLLDDTPKTTGPHVDGDTFVYVRSSPDGRYHLIAVGAPPFTLWSFAPFYFLVLASILLVSWWVARSIVPPLRTMSSVAERFGAGDLSARVTHAPANEIGTLAGVFNGMADRVQTLLQAERRLLQDVSHELRSPLARLNFSVELARTATDPGAALDRIQDDVDLLSTLVGELIEMTRAEGDPTARGRGPVDLHDLIGEVHRTCAREAEPRGVRVTVSGDVAPTLDGDRELLRRGIENVVRNAVRYTPDDGVVDVQVANDTDRVRIAVRDAGPGVPDAELERIFEPFYRVDASRDAAAGGIGLGLAIARRAIEVHHGTVAAENAHPGLRVTIALPMSARKASQDAA